MVRIFALNYIIEVKNFYSFINLNAAINNTANGELVLLKERK